MLQDEGVAQVWRHKANVAGKSSNQKKPIQCESVSTILNHINFTLYLVKFEILDSCYICIATVENFKCGAYILIFNTLSSLGCIAWPWILHWRHAIQFLTISNVALWTTVFLRLMPEERPSCVERKRAIRIRTVVFFVHWVFWAIPWYEEMRWRELVS